MFLVCICLSPTLFHWCSHQTWFVLSWIRAKKFKLLSLIGAFKRISTVEKNKHELPNLASELLCKLPETRLDNGDRQDLLLPCLCNTKMFCLQLYWCGLWGSNKGKIQKANNTMVVINVCVVGCQFFVVLGKENKDHHCVIKSPKMFILEWKKSCKDQEMSQWCMQLQKELWQWQSVSNLFLNWYSGHAKTGKGPEEVCLQVPQLWLHKTHPEKVRSPWGDYSWVVRTLEITHFWRCSGHVFCNFLLHS